MFVCSATYMNARLIVMRIIIDTFFILTKAELCYEGGCFL